MAPPSASFCCARCSAPVVSLLLAGLAGVLASLSPCVLPILPIVLAAAGAEHRLGPLALASR